MTVGRSLEESTGYDKTLVNLAYVCLLLYLGILMPKEAYDNAPDELKTFDHHQPFHSAV